MKRGFAWVIYLDEISCICNSVQLGLAATQRKETTKRRRSADGCFFLHNSPANEKLNRKCAICGVYGIGHGRPRTAATAATMMLPELIRIEEEEEEEEEEPQRKWEVGE
jgi:hypothetical protein